MKKLLVLITVLALHGCSSTRTGTQVSQNQLSEFSKGKTSYQEVITKLGAPDKVTTNPDGGREITYISTRTQPRAASFIPLIGSFVEGKDSITSTAIFKFNKRAILEDYALTETSTVIEAPPEQPVKAPWPYSATHPEP